MTLPPLPPNGDVVYTRMGNQVDPMQLPRTGYCQWCGRPGAQFETFRPESSARITFRTKVWFVCGPGHLSSVIREEGVRREDARDSGEPEVVVPNEKTIAPWKVRDRYCWRCGTHRDVTISATRCSTCGELQRLYIREGEGETS